MPESDLDVLIIGAGFSGIGLGIRLKQQGYSNFLIAEAASGVGGTWWANRYPGCACDVQSHLYSLSFAPNPNWTRQFAPRSEIQSYLDDCITRFDLSEHLRLDTRIDRAKWQEEDARWHVWDQHGNRYRARLLISAIGGLSRPMIPDIPGLSKFKGHCFHSQQWPDNLDLANKRVAVIGGGASAIQFVPKIASQVEQLDFYQRTPQWILPKPDRPIRPWKRRLYRRLTPLRLLRRLGHYLLLESRLPAFNLSPGWSSRLTFLHRRKALGLLRKQIDNPALRQKLTPGYAMGCKRVLMSNDFYPALNRANVNVLAGTINEIRADGIVGADNVPRPADILILATGFQATRPLPGGMIFGREGKDLADVWAIGPSAYKGSAVAGFPNFFTLLGPNTALGHNSVLLMIEAQINYVLGALQSLENGRESLEVKRDLQLAWNQRLDQTLDRSVWSRGGCGSWYLHPVSGRNTTLWPDYTRRFAKLTAEFDQDAYD